MTVENRWIREPHTGDAVPSRGGSLHVSVKAKRRDKVCSEFDYQAELEQLRETLKKEFGEAASDDARLDARLKVVRHLKRLFRCEGTWDEGVAEVATLVPELEEAVVESAGTVLGGHLMAVAGWANPTRSALRRLGATTIDLAHQAGWGDGSLYTAGIHRARSKAAAKVNTSIFRRVQGVACMGHHYTSHLAPGVFTDSTVVRAFDLRYDVANEPGGFLGVSVMAVSGCSMTCNLAQRALRAAFPRARFMGSRKTMPLKSGSKIWPAFAERLSADATPLLLDNTQDIDHATSTWLHANVVALRSEARRLLEKEMTSPSDSQVEAKFNRLLRKIGPGYAEGLRAHRILDDTLATTEVPLGDPDNSCSRKGDDRSALVAPKGLVLPEF